MKALFVGIDVSKDHLNVHIRSVGEVLTVGGDLAGIEALIGRLVPFGVRIIGIEATGGFEIVVAAGLALAGRWWWWSIRRKCAHLRTHLRKRAKTDPIDAAMITHFIDVTKPEIRPLPDEDTRLLADLVARRKQIVEMIGGERQRERPASNRPMKKSIARLLKALDKELASLDQSLDDNVRGSPAWRAKEDLLSRCRALERPSSAR